jgi:hypothetical protein
MRKAVQQTVWDRDTSVRQGLPGTSHRTLSALARFLATAVDQRRGTLGVTEPNSAFYVLLNAKR